MSDRTHQVALLLQNVVRSESEASLLALSQLFETVSDHEAASLLASSEVGQVAAAVGKAYRRWVSAREEQDAQRLAQSKRHLVDEDDGFARRTYTRVQDLFVRESFEGVSNFVMVGCGPLPATLLQVLERTRVTRVLGLDVRSEAVRAAATLLSGYAERVALLRRDGSDFDYAAWDFVYVANLVENKAGVLAQIARTAPQHVRVVVREPVGLGALVAEHGESSLPAGFEIRHFGPREPRFASRHMFLERRR